MEFKDGVSINGIKPEMVVGLVVAQYIYGKRNARFRITSVTEGEHSASSYHNNGYAIDFGTKGTGLAFQLWDDLNKALRGLGFDVILEDKDGSNEHIHVEFDVRRA